MSGEKDGFYSFHLRLFALVCALIFLAACFGSNQNSNSDNANQTVFETPAAPINLQKSLEISQKPEDVALAKRIDELIEQSEFADARWGVFVVGLNDGRVLAARDAQKLFTPASALKILTAAVALDRLGADFRWRTRVFAAKNVENGTLDGDLILYGQGAPDFSEAGVENLAAQLQAKGVRKINGNIVGDESYFKGDNLGDGWAWNELQWYYGAEASALSVNRNEVDLTVQNGVPRIKPENDFVKISGEIQANQNGAPDAIGVKRELGENKIHVWGEGKNLDVRVAVKNPALWSAQILRGALQKKGIAVAGEARSADWKTANKTNVEEAFELAAVESAPLGGIVRKMNKDSVNLYAELILRTLGKRFGDGAPDENPKSQKTRGTDAAGAAVIKQWLAENGASFQETESIKDGSGLSRLNFVTPETVGRALIAANQMKSAQAFRDSLPIAGTDGTLRGRLTNFAGKIRAKTGSIMFVNALAGYAKTDSGETLAFVILCNNETRKADSSVLIDRIAAELAKY
jgi:serine-type D-Ala-D-Ala carboxypeptidase/endopeptidase (penicillin-binding protein 4)